MRERLTAIRTFNLRSVLLPVERGEGPTAFLLYALLTIMVLSDWVGKVGADSLFVKRFGVQYIPLMYVITPIVMLVISAVLFGALHKRSGRSMLLWYVGLVMVASVAIQLALPMGGLVLPIAYVFAHGVKEVIYLLFWMYAGSLYGSSQSKRLFPLFAGALLTGKILGGFIASTLTPLIHTQNFMGIQAVGFLACLVLMLAFRRYLPAGAADAPATPAKLAHHGLRESLRSSADGYHAISSDRLLRVLAVGVFLWYLLMQVGSYLYLVGLDLSSITASARGSEDAFSQLYASVYTSSSIVALIIQTFLTGALLKRFGVSKLLFVLPVWYVGSFFGAMVNLNFLTAVSIQMGERIVVPALHRPGTEMIFNQVASSLRPRARAFISGAVNALGQLAAAAVLLIAAASGVPLPVVLGASAVVALGFVVNAWCLRRSLGLRLTENAAGTDEELRSNALHMLTGERHNVPVEPTPMPAAGGEGQREPIAA